MGFDVWHLLDRDTLLGCQWLEGEGGSERVREALAGEKAAGISHIWGSLDSPITGWDWMEFQRQLS